MFSKEDVARLLMIELRSLSNKAQTLDDVALNATLLDELNIDSLDILEIAMSLEEELDIEISDSFLEKYDTITVESFVDYVYSTVQNTAVE